MSATPQRSSIPLARELGRLAFFAGKWISATDAADAHGFCNGFQRTSIDRLHFLHGWDDAQFPVRYGTGDRDYLPQTNADHCRPMFD